MRGARQHNHFVAEKYETIVSDRVAQILRLRIEGVGGRDRICASRKVITLGCFTDKK